MNTKNITLVELANYLDDFLNPLRIEEDAYNGIQIANDVAISKVATAVSTSLETIEQAAALGAQALIVHHGIFRKDDSHPITDTRYKKIKLLFDHHIALLCYHLPLDAHQEIGNNWKAARDLGLDDIQPFLVYNDAPIGVIGSIASTTFDEFKKTVEDYYGRSANAVKVKDIISSVAITSGRSDKFIVAAARAGADCFITGSVDEPVWDQAHEENISFLGLGHYATEVIGPRALGAHLQEHFKIPCTFIKTHNPF